MGAIIRPRRNAKWCYVTTSYKTLKAIERPRSIGKTFLQCYSDSMHSKHLRLVFSIVSVIGAFWGFVFAFFGLGILPVSPDVLAPWGNGVYGATLIGLSVTFFFVGRHAFRRNDAELMKALLFGIFAWLIIEGLFSLYWGVYLNVGVDIGVLVLLSFPLIKGMRLSLIHI